MTIKVRKLFTLSLMILLAVIIFTVVFSSSSVAIAEDVTMVFPESGYTQSKRVDLIGANNSYIVTVDNESHTLHLSGASFGKVALPESILKIYVFAKDVVLTSPTTNYLLDVDTMTLSQTRELDDAYITSDGNLLFAHRWGEVKVYGHALVLENTYVNDVFKNKPVLVADDEMILSFTVDYGVNKLYTYSTLDGSTSELGSVFVENAQMGEVIFAHDGEKIILIDKENYGVTTTDLTDKNFAVNKNSLYVAKGEKGYDVYTLSQSTLKFHSNVSYTGEGLDKLNGVSDVAYLKGETVISDTLNNRVLFVGATTVSLAVDNPTRLATSDNRLYVLSGNQILVIENKAVKNSILSASPVRDLVYSDRLYILTENGVYTLVSGTLIRIFEVFGGKSLECNKHFYVLKNDGVSVFDISGEVSKLHSFPTSGYTTVDLMVDKAGNVFVLGEDSAVHVYKFEDVFQYNTGSAALLEGTPVTLVSHTHSFTFTSIKDMGDKVYLTSKENAILSADVSMSRQVPEVKSPDLDTLPADVYVTTDNTYFIENTDDGTTARKIDSVQIVVGYDDGSKGVYVNLNGKLGWLVNLSVASPSTGVNGVYITAESVTLYTNPLFDSTISLNKGTALTVIDDAAGYEDGKWFRVEYNGGVYFAERGKLVKDTSAPTPPPHQQEKPIEEVKVNYGRAKASRVGELVNLYADANGQTVVTSVKDSTKLEIIEKVGEYYKVVHEGQEVFIHESQFKLNGLTTVQVVAIVLSVVVLLAGTLVFAVTTLIKKKENL